MRVSNRVCRSRFSLLIFLPGANPLTLETSSRSSAGKVSQFSGRKYYTGKSEVCHETHSVALKPNEQKSGREGKWQKQKRDWNRL